MHLLMQLNTTQQDSRTIWHRGQFGTADNLAPQWKTDNLAPQCKNGQFGTRTIWHRHVKRTIWHRGQFGTKSVKRTIWYRGQLHNAKNFQSSLIGGPNITIRIL